jgi:hypothetical protein
MPQDVVVVFVHGINVNCQDYHRSMCKKILKAMPKHLHGHVIFRRVFWADIVRDRQQEYLHYASTRPHFCTTKLHHLIVEGLGDAAAYQKTRERQNSAYYQIQERLERTLKDVALGENDHRPLVFIGHSLGCHIISSYAWDLHKRKAIASGHKSSGKELLDSRTDAKSEYQYLAECSPLERLDTFAGLVTMGSNMPLFTFTFGPQHVFPITNAFHHKVCPAFPGEKLPHEVKAQARWLNFYSRNDPLGYPLKPLNDAYDEEMLLCDIHTPSEGWLWSSLLRGPFRSLRPLAALTAHTGYWTDPRVARGTADLLQDIIRAEEWGDEARRKAAGQSGARNAHRLATPEKRPDAGSAG